MCLARYPNVERAAMEIAYDNGAINRMRSISSFRTELDRWIAKQARPLVGINDTLGRLELDDFDVVCAGEQSEAAAILGRYGNGDEVSALLTAIFDEVL